MIILYGHRERLSFLAFLYLLSGRKRKVISQSRLHSPFEKAPSASPVVKEHAEFTTPELLKEHTEFTAPELLAEFENNCRIVNEFSGDNLLPLQSDVWDSQRYSLFRLPSNLREQLEQVYDEIHQLNSIVWLSTELSHRTSLSDEIYRQLLTSIAERLNSIKQNME